MKRKFLPLLLLSLAACFQLRAQVVISAVNSAYKQDFDTLDNTSGDTSAVMPTGWYFAKPKVTSKSYKVDNGGSNSGNVYSYGATSSTDRALGSIASGTTSPIIGAAFKNSTGKTITSVHFKYIVEQWRLGATGRHDTAKCEISINAKSVDDASASWVPVSQLNLMSPVTSGTTGALNGNDGANEDTIDYTITGLSLFNGFTVWVRWSDINISGSDDGLAIDNFELTANPVPKPVNPTVSFATTATTVAESVDSVQVALAIKNPNHNPTSVKVSVNSASTASMDTDYVFKDSTFTFPADSSNNINFWIKVIDDKKNEPSETIVLKLSNATNSAILGDSMMTITITDNDSIDRHYKIRQVKMLDANGVLDSLGKKAILTGVVSSWNYAPAGLNFYIYDSTGAINVFSSSKTYGYMPAAGDSVSVSGIINNFSGLAEIQLGSQTTDSVMLMSTGNKVVNPLIVKKLDESTESKLIKIENVKLVDPSKWVKNTNMTLDVTNGIDTFAMFVDKDITLAGKSAPVGKFDVVGIGGQHDTKSPYDSAYQILPRRAEDIMQVRLYTISEIRAVDVNGVPSLKDSIVRFKGIVESGNFTPAGAEFYVYDNTGAVNVYSGKPVFGYTVAMGDSVEVEGKVSQYNGLTEVIFSTPGKDTIIHISSGNAVKAPKAITKMTESDEGDLVIFKNAHLVDPTKWVAAGSGFNVNVTDGTDTIQVRVDKDVDLFNAPAPKGNFNVTGVVSQFDNSSPYFSGYQLLPRGIKDIKLLDTLPTWDKIKWYTVSQLKANDANGVPSLNDSLVRAKGIVSSGATNFNSNGLEIAFYDNTGGMTIYFSNMSFGYTPKAGDSIEVVGKLGAFDGLTEIELSGMKGVDTLIKLNSGNTVKSPAVVTALSETTESELVQINGLKLVDPTQWTTGTGTGGFTVKAYKGTDTFDIRIDNNVDLYNMTAPSGTLNIVGIGSQFDPSSPYTSGYQLLPRDSNDIVVVTGIKSNNELENSLSVYPNPASEMLNVQTASRADWITVTDVLGQEVIRLRPNSNMERIDVSTLKPGVYFIQVRQGENAATQKFIRR